LEFEAFEDRRIGINVSNAIVPTAVARAASGHVSPNPTVTSQEPPHMFYSVSCVLAGPDYILYLLLYVPSLTDFTRARARGIYSKIK
jgi:hypothetical protein